MANIKVKDLAERNITGVALFSDSESFMQDLSGDELDLYGGGKVILPTPIVIATGKTPAPTPPIFELP